jgi:hypothetical protein
MNNEEIYIDEIITLWSNEDGVCLSNDLQYR